MDACTATPLVTQHDHEWRWAMSRRICCRKPNSNGIHRGCSECLSHANILYGGTSEVLRGEVTPGPLGPAWAPALATWIKGAGHHETWASVLCMKQEWHRGSWDSPTQLGGNDAPQKCPKPANRCGVNGQDTAELQSPRRRRRTPSSIRRREGKRPSHGRLIRR